MSLLNSFNCFNLFIMPYLPRNITQLKLYILNLHYQIGCIIVIIIVNELYENLASQRYLNKNFCII
jgi:hypothetical protein